MNIWIFNHYAVPPTLPGGTRHYDFAIELSKRGYKVRIFASSFHYSQHKETKEFHKKYYINDKIEDIYFTWIKTFPYQLNNWRRIVNMLSYALRVYKIAKKENFEKPHIIIGSSVHLFAVYAAYLLTKRFKVPFVMEVRDLWPQTLIDMGISRYHPFTILLGILERFLYKKADRIITLLPKSMDYIAALGINRKKLMWIPNGVDLKRFEKNITDEIVPKKNKQFLITYTGAIGKANSLDIVIDAAELTGEKDKNIKFLFVGDGPEKNKLIKMVKDKNLKNVEFKEPVPKEEVIKILYASDALVLNLKDSPLYKYGISLNKLFDYLASGKPILFSGSAGNNPVKEAKAGITIPVQSPEKLAEAILYMKNLPENKRVKMGLRGKKYVEKYHAIPILVDKLEGILNDLAKN